MVVGSSTASWIPARPHGVGGITQGKCRQSMLRIWSVGFTPDGRQAISGSATVRLWDLDDGRLLRTFGRKQKAVVAKISPDGRTILASGFYPTITLWDMKTGRELASLEGYWNWIRAVEFSPDGRQALSGAGGIGPPPWKPGNDFAVRLWQLPQ